MSRRLRQAPLPVFVVLVFVPPLLLLALLGYLSYSSRARYEQVEPPLRSESPVPGQPA